MQLKSTYTRDTITLLLLYTDYCANLSSVVSENEMRLIEASFFSARQVILAWGDSMQPLASSLPSCSFVLPITLPSFSSSRSPFSFFLISKRTYRILLRCLEAAAISSHSRLPVVNPAHTDGTVGASSD